jgi:hypothetical protein
MTNKDVLGEFPMEDFGFTPVKSESIVETTQVVEQGSDFRVQESVDTEEEGAEPNLTLSQEDADKQRQELLGSKEKPVDSEDTQEENIYKNTAQNLQEAGLLEFTDQDTIESNDDIINIYNRNIENKVQDFFNKRFENHPQKEKAEALFKYIEDGGDIDRFTEAYANPLSFIDLQNEKDQERVVALKLKSTTRLTDEKIKDKIQKLKDAALLEEEAKDSFEELDSIRKENEQALLQETAQLAQRQKQENIQYQNEMRDFINKNESIKGIIDIKSKKDKELILDYLFKPTEKVGNQLVTKYVKDQQEESIEDFMAIAALKAKGFDFKKLEKSVEVNIKNGLAEKLNKISKENARPKGEGRVKEQDILRGKQLSQDEKNDLWKKFQL